MARPSLDQAFYLRLLLLLSVLHVAYALSPEKARGIAPQDLKYFESDPIWCRDKSKSFPASRLNDDFCDCPDGTDEPGTSACPEGRFFCKNKGASPKVVFSSRVNDGICDCCDGSDEYDGKTKCADTCWEAGRKAREKLEKKIATFKEGVRIRARDVENSKQLRGQEEKELGGLKKDESTYKHAVNKLKAQVDAIEEAEKLEREKKEKEEREKAENATETVDVHDSHEIKTALDPANAEASYAEQNDVPQSEDTKVEEEGEVDLAKDEGEELKDPESVEGLSKEELGRLVASRWTGERGAESEEATTRDDSAGDATDNLEYEAEAENYGSHQDEPDDEDDDEQDHNSWEKEDQSQKRDATEETASWWHLVRQAPRALLNVLGLNRMRVDLSEAERIRSEYAEADKKLNEVRSRISELESKLKHDFGKDGQFYSLYGRCYEKRQSKYLYKVCPFKKATQEEGHSSTRLGDWKGLEDNYRSMEFTDGDHCWNGPNRSLKVRLKCGLRPELSEVEEPSRCEYAATLTTPALCREERLKELQAQLRGAAASASSHDEL